MSLSEFTENLRGLRLIMGIDKVPVKEESTLIIIPTYNEKGNIRPLIAEIIEFVPWVDVLVVDDQSPDGTAQLVKDLSRQHEEEKAGGETQATGKVSVLVREGERGLGGAYRAGLKYGMEHNYEILLTMDADHSHNPLHLRAILSAIEEHDVVIGSRYTRDGGTINWRIRRILLSWLANRFARRLLGLKGSDLTSGFRAYRREIIESIGLEHVQSNGYSYLVEMLFWAQRRNARVAEVPIIFFDRSLGKSKISKKEIFRGAFTLIRLRFSRIKG